MTAFINKSGWKSIGSMFVNVAGSWKKVSRGFINVGGSWKLFFSSGVIPTIAQKVTISQSTATNGIITLTGRNYSWTNFSSAIYEFQVSIDATNWTTIDTGSITNPSSGSSNTKTFIVQQSNLTANNSNDFRFVVTATSSSGGSGSSTSDSTTIEMPRDITNLSYTDAQRNQITLSWTASAYAGRQMLYYKYTSSGDEAYALYGGYSGSTNSATVTGLNANKSYSFRILPYTGTTNSAGYYGNYSNVLNVSTLAGPTPTVNNVTISNITDSTATVNWTSTDQLGYEVTGGPITYIGSSGTTQNIGGLAANTTYTITVTVTADGGGQASANSAPFTTQAAFVTPSAVAPTVTTTYPRSDGLAGQQWDWDSVTITGSGTNGGYQWELSTTASSAGYLSTGITTGLRLVTGSTATRYARVRVLIDGSDLNTYTSPWSGWVLGSTSSGTTTTTTAATTTTTTTATTTTTTTTTTTAAPGFNGTTCTTLDRQTANCRTTGCDIGGCGSGAACNGSINRCF